jgi:hypothetical protein
MRARIKPLCELRPHPAGVIVMLLPASSLGARYARLRQFANGCGAALSCA